MNRQLHVPGIHKLLLRTGLAVLVCKRNMSAVTPSFSANWTPLEQLISPRLCAEFMWMFQIAGLEHYKHIETRRYLRLDGEGKCYVPADPGWKEVPFEDEWKRITGRT